MRTPGGDGLDEVAAAVIFVGLGRRDAAGRGQVLGDDLDRVARFGDQAVGGVVAVIGRALLKLALRLDRLGPVAARIVGEGVDDRLGRARAVGAGAGDGDRLAGLQPAPVEGVDGDSAQLVGHADAIAEGVEGIGLGEGEGVGDALQPVELVAGERGHRIAGQVAEDRRVGLGDSGGLGRRMLDRADLAALGVAVEGRAAGRVGLRGEAVELVVAEIAGIAARIGQLHQIAVGVVEPLGDGVRRTVEGHRLLGHPAEAVVDPGDGVAAAVLHRRFAAQAVIAMLDGRGFRGSVSARLGEHLAIGLVDPMGGACGGGA